MRCIGLLVFFLWSCQSPLGQLEANIENIAGYFRLLEKDPARHSWQAQHTDETYEDLSAYTKRKINRPDQQHQVVYILPFNIDVTEHNKMLLGEMVRFNEAVLGLPVRVMPNVLYQLPISARRDGSLGEQFNSRYLIDSVLPHYLPDDAACMLAITDGDLYPQNDWNFVFGQASLQKKVGVWSLARIADSKQQTTVDRLCKISIHEILHMFSIRHCVRYECMMNGSNSMYETDIQPKILCPDCMMKRCYNFKESPAIYCERMQRYYQTKNEMTYFALLDSVRKHI